MTVYVGMDVHRKRSQIVAQQLCGGRDRGRRPPGCDRGGWVAGQVQQGPEGGHARGAVGNDVMRDTYAVDIAAGQDDLLVLSSVLALDMAEDQERQ